MKSAAALLPRANDFIASSCRNLSACILIAIGFVTLGNVLDLAGSRKIDFDNFADLRWDVCHDEYAIGEVNGFVYVGCHEKCCTTKFVVQVCIIFLHQTLSHRIEAAKRLVKNHHVRPVDHRACQFGPTLHAAGELRRIFSTERRKANLLKEGFRELTHLWCVLVTRARAVHNLS